MYKVPSFRVRGSLYFQKRKREGRGAEIKIKKIKVR